MEGVPRDQRFLAIATRRSSQSSKRYGRSMTPWWNTPFTSLLNETWSSRSSRKPSEARSLLYLPLARASESRRRSCRASPCSPWSWSLFSVSSQGSTWNCHNIQIHCIPWNTLLIKMQHLRVLCWSFCKTETLVDCYMCTMYIHTVRYNKHIQHTSIAAQNAPWCISWIAYLLLNALYWPQHNFEHY